LLVPVFPGREHSEKAGAHGMKGFWAKRSQKTLKGIGSGLFERRLGFVGACILFRLNCFGDLLCKIAQKLSPKR